MAYVSAFWKITWGFTVANSDETAYTSLSIAGAAVTDPAPSPSTLNSGDLSDLADAMLGLMGGGGMGWADYSHLTSVKVAKIGTDGHYTEDPVVAEVGGSNAGSSTSVHPQLTVVVSLWSGESLGKGNYGRLFLPHTALPVQSGDPRAAASSAITVVTNAGIFLENVTAVTVPAWATGEPRIMGQTGSGTNKPVTQLRVGRVTDTQRRRRESLDEDYQVVAV